MNIAIIGDDGFHSQIDLKFQLDHLIQYYKPTFVKLIGTDDNATSEFVSNEARKGNWVYVRIPIDENHWGHDAIPIRSREMIDSYKADAALCFWNGKSQLVKDFMKFAKMKGVTVHVYNYMTRKLEIIEPNC